VASKLIRTVEKRSTSRVCQWVPPHTKKREQQATVHIVEIESWKLDHLPDK